MSYHANGLCNISSGYRQSCGDMGEPIMDTRINWNQPVPAWEESTIGELVNDNSDWSMSGVRNHELAWFILNNVAGVRLNTPCLVASSHQRLKAIRVGEYEHRSVDGVLHSRLISEIEAT